MNNFNMNLWKMFLAGGPIMWPILFCSVLALAITLERLWYLHSIKMDGRRFMDNIFYKLRHHQKKEAVQACDKLDTPLANVLKAGIMKSEHTKLQIKEGIEDASLYEVPKLEKNLTLLATIAHVSPLLGLLGTVTGMVKCFQTIQLKATSFQPVSPGDLAGGIWEALLTTVAGLIVAIPAFVAYNYLVSRVSGIVLEMEKASTELVNFLTE